MKGVWESLKCAVSLAVSALTGNILVHIISILVFRAQTRQNWFDMILGIPVETQLGIFCRKKDTLSPLVNPWPSFGTKLVLVAPVFA